MKAVLSVIILIFITSCDERTVEELNTPPNRVPEKYCINGVSYFVSFRRDPLLMLDVNSNVIPCTIENKK